MTLPLRCQIQKHKPSYQYRPINKLRQFARRVHFFFTRGGHLSPYDYEEVHIL